MFKIDPFWLHSEDDSGTKRSREMGCSFGQSDGMGDYWNDCSCDYSANELKEIRARYDDKHIKEILESVELACLKLNSYLDERKKESERFKMRASNLHKVSKKEDLEVVGDMPF